MPHVRVTWTVTYPDSHRSKFVGLALYLQTSLLQEKWGTSKTKQVLTEPAFSGKQWWYQFNIRYDGAYFLPLQENEFSLLLNHLSSLSALLTATGFPLALVSLRNGFVSLIALLAPGFSWLASLCQYCSLFISPGRIKPRNLSHGRAGSKLSFASVRGLHELARCFQDQSQSWVPQWAPAAKGPAPFLTSPDGNSCFMSCQCYFKLYSTTVSFFKSIFQSNFHLLSIKNLLPELSHIRFLYLTL